MDILTLTSSNPIAKFNDISIYILELEIDHRILRKAFNEYPSNSLLYLKMTNNRVKILSNIKKVDAFGCSIDFYKFSKAGKNLLFSKIE